MGLRIANPILRSGRRRVGILDWGRFVFGLANAVSDRRLSVRPDRRTFGRASVAIDYAGNAYSHTPELTASQYAGSHSRFV